MTQRYQRHSLIDWFDQARLHEAHVIVIGAGAVGNEVLKNLSLLGVGTIHVFDFDRIEEHNLTRCVLFRDGDVGRFKAEVAAEACRQIDPNIVVCPSILDFWDALTLDRIASSDAVICCVDNFEARIQLNRLCLMVGTDFVSIGIDSRYLSVEAFPFSTNPDCACYECTLPPSAYIMMQKRYSCGWLRKIAYKERRVPTTAVTSSIAGAVGVSLVLNRLCGHPQGICTAIRHFHDTITLETALSVPQRCGDCPTCGSIDPHAFRMLASRNCGNTSVIPLGTDVGGVVLLSEPILISGTCKLCGRVQEYYESVRRLTEAVTICSNCKEQSVRTEFVERLNAADFRRLFADRRLPVKYFSYITDDRQFIIELED